MNADETWMSETVEFETSDGVTLTGDLTTPADAAGPSNPSDGGAVMWAVAVCHPHPQYGGNRNDHVVTACSRALTEAGIPSLRFDFRPEFGLGEAEQLDLIAALDVLAATFPSARLAAIGYSFGAMVSLATGDDRIAAKVLIAPPLTRMQVDPAGTCPMYVLAPAHDQFTPPPAVRDTTDKWAMINPSVSMEIVEMGDHFLHGRADHVAERATAWLRVR